jgi:hypothetical protein
VRRAVDERPRRGSGDDRVADRAQGHETRPTERGRK